MTPERWAQIRQIFEGAIERAPKDRAAYLRVVCARDDAMRREVESLLESHDDASSFLAKPAVDPGYTLHYSGEESGEYPTGFRAGPYQLEKRIGRGGMGSVWLACAIGNSQIGNSQKVAIKLVRRGMDTTEILRRFRMERQVLASLAHPNIARLIDGGSTPEGMPYLAMEYVEGIPIDQFCERRANPITDRLKLFRDVCAAVQYAHQNLVVHRDIKMGNILVTDTGVVKLLDFGIAKLLRTDLSTLEMAQTRPEMRPMTLDYASPEQVRGEAITTSTDVYSLGVLLYKLLTGKTPYGLT
ncbi:MAG: serine/threonine-protein kinase, partial [Bryobacteraceae bacterium]